MEARRRIPVRVSLEIAGPRAESLVEMARLLAARPDVRGVDRRPSER